MLQGHHQGIEGAHTEEHRLEKTRRCCGAREADDASDGCEFRARLNYQTNDRGPLRAKRHADRHFLQARGDGKSDDAVDAENREQYGGECEA